MISNLWLLAQLLFKVSLMTGIGPGFIALLIFRRYYARRPRRAPAKVIEFSSWGGERRDRAGERSVSNLG